MSGWSNIGESRSERRRTATRTATRPRRRSGLAALALVLGSLASQYGVPAGASGLSSIDLVTTASPNTTVGYQIFGNVNLMHSSVMPSGTVTFRMYGPINTACAGPPAFSSTVEVTGVSVNSATFQTFVAGIYRWTTTYSGDDFYAPAGPTACYLDSAKVLADKVRNVLRVSALPPADGILVAKADLTGYFPNGPITFTLTGPADPFCSLPPAFIGSVRVVGAGTYTSPAFTPTLPGTYQWRARYGGDNDNRGTSTGCMNEDASVAFRLDLGLGR